MKDLKNIDKALKDFLEKTKNKAVGDSIPQMQQEITQNVINSFSPVIQMLADNAKINKDDLASVLKEIQIMAPEVKIPDFKFPEFKIPTPQVTVNVPELKQPIVKVEPTPVTFPDSMALRGVDRKNPLPAMLVDVKGNPMQFPVSMSGGKADFFTIKDIMGSTGSLIDQVEGALKVTGNFSVTSSATSTLAQLVNSDGTSYNSDNPLPISGSFSSTPFGTYFASDTVGSTNLIQVGGNTINTDQGYSYPGTLRVVHATDVGLSVNVTGANGTLATNMVDSSGIAYSGSNPVPMTGSVSVSGVTGSIGATILNGEGLARDSWLVSDITNSVKTALVDSTGVQYSGSNPLPVTATVSGITNSISATITDSTGVQYSGSNPLPITAVGGGPDSMFIYQARTTNPTAVSDGADVRPKADKLGRAINRPVQVRDLTVTAYTSVSNGTEATLLSATAGKYHDLIYVLASNNSTAAVGMDIRGVTAGNILLHLEIPANGTVGVATPVPIPQTSSDSGNAWTVDLPDITGTTVYVSALFTQEI